MTSDGGHEIQLSTAVCRYCLAVGEIRIEWRQELQVRPLGFFSLAGQQMKAPANYVDWPWAVCGNCGHESRGERC